MISEEVAGVLVIVVKVKNENTFSKTCLAGCNYSSCRSRCPTCLLLRSSSVACSVDRCIDCFADTAAVFSVRLSPESLAFTGEVRHWGRWLIISVRQSRTESAAMRAIAVNTAKSVSLKPGKLRSPPQKLSQ